MLKPKKVTLNGTQIIKKSDGKLDKRICDRGNHACRCWKSCWVSWTTEQLAEEAMTEGRF